MLHEEVLNQARDFNSAASEIAQLALQAQVVIKAAEDSIMGVQESVEGLLEDALSEVSESVTEQTQAWLESIGAKEQFDAVSEEMEASRETLLAEINKEVPGSLEKLNLKSLKTVTDEQAEAIAEVVSDFDLTLTDGKADLGDAESALEGVLNKTEALKNNLHERISSAVLGTGKVLEQNLDTLESEVTEKKRQLINEVLSTIRPLFLEIVNELGLVIEKLCEVIRKKLQEMTGDSEEAQAVVEMFEPIVEQMKPVLDQFMSIVESFGLG